MTDQSNIIQLAQIKNIDGFRFIGIDKDGGRHFCIVRRGDDGSFYMSSNTITFDELVGWIPDPQNNV
jgi:hypothetical protein